MLIASIRSRADRPALIGLLSIGLILLTICWPIGHTSAQDATPAPGAEPLPTIPRPEECTVPRLTADEAMAYYQRTAEREETVLEIEGYERVDPGPGAEVRIDDTVWITAGVVSEGRPLPGRAPTDDERSAIEVSIRQLVACQNKGDELAWLRLIPRLFVSFYLGKDINPDDNREGLDDDGIVELVEGEVEPVSPASWLPVPAIRTLRMVNDTFAPAVVSVVDAERASGDPAPAAVIWIVFEDGLWKIGPSITPEFPDPDPESRAREDAAFAREREALLTLDATPSP